METTISLHVQPKASRTAIVGAYGECLKIAVQAPPVDGAANEALEIFLAETFSLPRKNISLKSGSSGRKKIFILRGISPEKAKLILGEIL